MPDHEAVNRDSLCRGKNYIIWHTAYKFRQVTFMCDRTWFPNPFIDWCYRTNSAALILCVQMSHQASLPHGCLSIQIMQVSLSQGLPQLW